MVALALLLAAMQLQLAQPGEAAIASQTIVSGGSLPHPIRLAAVDEDAFFRRLNFPPILDNAPAVTGPSYTVDSPYWPEVIAARGVGGGVPAESRAIYYPEGGFVNARQAGRDVWLIIDLRQRAVLDRYIRLGLEGKLSPQPGIIEVLAAAARSEVISIEVGALPLNPAQASALWASLAGLKPLAPPAESAPPRDGPGSVWIIFGLPEGRSVQVMYTQASGTLVDSLGSEVYALPGGRWLSEVTGREMLPGTASGLSRSIEHQQPAGSWLWWPLMLGGGTGSLALAVWLRRRWQRQSL